MELAREHISALDKAEALIFHSDFCPYLELKEMLPDATPEARNRFRLLFTNYYGLNVGRLSDDFKNRFFDILFGWNVVVDDQPDFQAIFGALSEIPRRQGGYTMQFSFVSKLVAMHLETSPIYDRHVLAFFGQRASAASKPKDERITWYVKFLNEVAADYVAWATDARVIRIIDRLKARDHRLAQCHVIRLLDFLVWKVGNQKLL